MADPHPLVCRFGAFGDMVLLTPLLKHLYQRCGKPCDLIGIGGWNRQLFAEMPWVRHIYTIDSRAAPYWINRGQRELVTSLSEAQHQYAWVCETDSRSFRLLSRAGIDRHNSVAQPDLEKVENEHYCDKWLRLAQLSPSEFDFPPIEPEAPNTALFVKPSEVVECQGWLMSRKLDPKAPIVCIQAGSKRTTRRGRANRASNTKFWKPNNWAAVINGVLGQDSTTQVLLCGLPAEAEMCEDILAQCKDKSRVQSVADDLPMRRLLALLSIAHSCISVDTGPAHAAAALNCPLVVLFGQANPNRFRPVSSESPISILIGKTAAGASDISQITPDQVLQSWSALD